jgi:hypothetical protein
LSLDASLPLDLDDDLIFTEGHLPDFNWNDLPVTSPDFPDLGCAFDEMVRQADEERDEEAIEKEDVRVAMVESLRLALLSWYVQFNVKSNALDALLKILRTHGFEELPKTARALRGNESVSVLNRSGMQYVYLGIKEGLARCLEGVADIPHSIALSFNIDGLPIFSSSGKGMWPILCSFKLGAAARVFPVALTYGLSKPKDLEFLRDFADELTTVMRSGVSVLHKQVQVTVKAVVCDAPAKAFVLATKLCTGHFGCGKCTQKGRWEGRVTYPQTEDLSMRNDIDFRFKSQPEHHTGTTPLIETPLDLVEHFPIDYMHQVCLGVMRKLLQCWVNGDRRFRLSAGQVGIISCCLRAIARFVPSVFARKPRGLEELNRWKATEFRQFLMYTGFVALKGVVRSDVYQHFMSLSTAICILCDPKQSDDFDYAGDLLRYFVEQGGKLYGPEFLVYNVHSLLHLADQAKRFGSLDECSAFAFESFLGRLKSLVASGKNPLAQIVHRLDTALLPGRFSKRDAISCKSPNNAFIVDGKACVVLSKVGEDSFRCRQYLQSVSVFDSPMDSLDLGKLKCPSNSTAVVTLHRD